MDRSGIADEAAQHLHEIIFPLSNYAVRFVTFSPDCAVYIPEHYKMLRTSEIVVSSNLTGGFIRRGHFLTTQDFRGSSAGY